jgi:hypothetical protein
MSIVANLATFRVLVPDFASLDDPTIQLHLDIATSFVTSCALSADKKATAQMYLAAHMLALARPGLSSAGAVTQETVGAVSRSYANPTAPSMSATELGSTKYGLAYRSVLRSAGLSFVGL